VRHALATLLGTVQRTIRAHQMLAPGQRVLVAVSGGPDSTGLLLVLATLRRKLGVTLVAAHVNHRLRGREADLDEACAAAAAAALDVPFVRAELDGDLGRGGNLEARARRQRYAALHSLAAELGCAAVATGHTLDDQAETVLMRLLRGSGGRGLAAIHPRRADGVIRPLLDCRRAAVAAVVRDAGLATRTDASNRDPRFLRTHVRERVLPLLREFNPAIAQACANLAAAAGAERRVVTAWADAQLAAVAPDGELRVAALLAIVPPLRPLLVRRWLVRAGVPARLLTARHVHCVVRLAEAEKGRAETHLPARWSAQRSRGSVRVERRPVGPTRAVARSGEKLF
jgi:tRNA(Ile)-lysidine synthase